MSEVVVEVGPGTIRGANDVPLEWVSAALDCIDDDLALIDDHPVCVEDLWDDVMRSAVGASVDSLVVVCPAWWSAARIEKVRQAAHTVGAEVAVLERISILREEFSTETTIVEITPDVAVVSVWGTIAAVVPLQKESIVDAEAVMAAVGGSAAVVVDAPAGVLGAGILASTIADRMRVIGVPVRIAADDCVLRSVRAKRSRSQGQSAEGAVGTSAILRNRRALAVVSGAVAVVLLCGVFAVAHEPRAGGMPMTLLVEGRIGVMVPATWTARRITSGPGSARVQVVSPTDGDVALHITQSAVPQPSTLAATADALLAALTGGADDAFVEFNPSDRRGDRDAVTYREVRPGRDVAWTVVIDGTVRIAVGCQSVPGREDLVREACDRAVRSAHAVA